MSFRPMGRWACHLLASASAAAVLLSAPAALGEDGFNPLGDGSSYDNADLLRDETTGCENCLPYPPHEWDDPWFDLDWSLALRGSFVSTTSGSYFEAAAVPTVTFRHDMLRGGYEATGSLEVTRSSVEEARIGAARIGLRGNYQLDSDTALEGSANLSLTQASTKALGADPTIIERPRVLSGDAEVIATRDIGPFVLTGRLNGSRTVYGPTTLVGPVTVDNTHQSNWATGAGLRIGYRVTPIVTAFVDGSAGLQYYDAVSPTLLVKLDAADLALRAGLAAEWNALIEAEASVGYGVRRFAEPTLGEAGALLYDASLTFRPDETLEMRGTFATSFGAPGPDSGGTARLEYAATGEVSYIVNPWLRLRALAGWSRAFLIGTPDVETTWSAGLGADYLLNEHTSLTADYAYASAETTLSPPEESHRVTVGVTFHD